MKFKDIKKKKIVKECEGCLKVLIDKTCKAYEKPDVWKYGCPLKTNKELETIEKKKINPIKKSKRRG